MKRFTVCGAGGVELAGVEFGGQGPGFLLLHGLTQRATHWAEMAGWLRSYGRVVAYDQRGHGRSGKPDEGYDRAAYVADAVAVLEQCGLAPAVVVGHSMGGLNAWQLAASRPDLVSGIVIGDMSAHTPPGLADGLAAWFASWPEAFVSLGEAVEFFTANDGGMGESFPEAMTEVLAETEDGYRPVFEARHLVATARAFAGTDFTGELAKVACPALVVRGSRSRFSHAEMAAMADRLPLGEAAEVEGAGHMLYLDRPREWRSAVEPFVRRLVGAGTGTGMGPGMGTGTGICPGAATESGA